MPPLDTTPSAPADSATPSTPVTSAPAPSVTPAAPSTPASAAPAATATPTATTGAGRTRTPVNGETPVARTQQRRQRIAQALEGIEIPSDLGRSSPAPSTGAGDGQQPPATPAPVSPTGAAAPAGTAAAATATGAPIEPGPGMTPELVARLQAMGFQDVRDEQDAQTRLLQAYEQERQRQQYLQAQYEQTRAMAEQYQRLQMDPRWQMFQQQQVQQPQAEQPQHWWNAPQVDLNRLPDYREEILDAEGKPTGQYKWRDDAPQEYREQVQQYQHKLKEWSEGLLTRPHEVLPQIIQQEAVPLIHQAIQQWQQQQQMQSFATGIEERHSDWLYQRDPVSNQVLRDFQGNPVMSPDGQRVSEYLAEATQLGIQDPRQRWNYAVKQFRAEVQDQLFRQRAQGQQVQQQVVDTRMQHLQRAAQQATAGTPRTGSIPTPTTPSRRGQERGLSPGERLAQNFRVNGLEPHVPA